MRPLRILHVTGTADGAPWLAALAREQRRLGHEVGVVMPSDEGRLVDALCAADVTCYSHPIDSLSPQGVFEKAHVVLGFARLLRQVKPDVVHSHIFEAVITSRLASWIADVPNRFSGSVGPLPFEIEILRLVDRGTTFCDTRTIASCTYTRELFHRYGVPESQTELIYYAVDQSRMNPALADGARVRRELGIDSDTPVIGMVAYFYPPLRSPAVFGPLAGRGLKGHDVLLEAMPRVLDAVPNAKLILVGRGWHEAGEEYERHLKDLAVQLGVAHAVLFIGERSDIPDVLASFDVSTHPGITDNLGGTVESLLMERPMVVSSAGGYADTVINGKTGLTVPVDDPPALADALIKLLLDRELARRLGEAGRRWMLERFTLERAVADTEELLSRCPARAEDGYRLSRRIVRTVQLPFRVWPILRTVRNRVRAHLPPQPFSVRVKNVLRRILKPPVRVSRKMRIAQVVAAWDNCDWFVSLCRDLAARGYDVVAVIDDRPGELASRLDAAGIKHYKVAMTFATGLDRARLPAYVAGIPIAAMKLARILRRERIDVVHSHVFTSVVIARFAAALARARHVAGIAGPRHLEAAFTRAIDRWTWWLDDITAAGCRYTLELYEKLGANRNRLDCIYYGGDATRFDPARADAAAMRRRLRIAPDTPVISLVAHFYAPTHGVQTSRGTAGRSLKGHDDFIAAARIVAERFPDARFVLAGEAVLEPGERYRQRLIEECRRDDVLRDRVIFAGHVDDVPSLLAASDVAVQCSLTENLGGTIEALLMERPVVATRAGGMPEAVRDGETGLLVPPSNPPALANAILRLLENREEAAAFASAGRRLMLERFTTARVADDVEAAYRRLVRAGFGNVAPAGAKG